MNLYRKVFTVVRLLDAVDLRLTGNNKTKEYQMGELNHCRCYDYWKKSQPCENCISRKVYQDRIQRTKLEYKENDLYEVTSPLCGSGWKAMCHGTGASYGRQLPHRRGGAG